MNCDSIELAAIAAMDESYDAPLFFDCKIWFVDVDDAFLVSFVSEGVSITQSLSSKDGNGCVELLFICIDPSFEHI